MTAWTNDELTKIGAADKFWKQCSGSIGHRARLHGHEL